MNKVVLLILLFAAIGCEPPHNREYRIRQIRPDGVIHKEWRILDKNKPWIHISKGGHSYIGMGAGRRFTTPPGWLLEVEFMGVKDVISP